MPPHVPESKKRSRIGRRDGYSASCRSFRNEVLDVARACLTAFLLGPALAFANAGAAQQTQTPTDTSAQSIVLGESVAPLYGPWKFHTGDSPIDPATGKRLWAELRFNDSAWEPVNLRPQPGDSDPFSADPRYVGGWTTKGHPDYSGWAWYRLRITVSTKTVEPLAISAPLSVDNSYQVFANGELIGGNGKFAANGDALAVYSGHPEMYPLPAADASHDGAPGVPLTLAFRVWMAPLLDGVAKKPGGGGLHSAPVLAAGSSIETERRQNWESVIITEAYLPIEALFFLLLALVAASLTLFDSSDEVYLWIAGTLLLQVVADLIGMAFIYTEWLQTRTYFFFVAIFEPFYLAAWIMVWRHWFRLRRLAWIPRTAAMLACFTLLCMAFLTFPNPASTPRVIRVVAYSDVAGRMALLALLILVLAAGIRRQGRASWVLLLAIVPMGIKVELLDILALGWGGAWFPFGVRVYWGSTAGFVMLAALALFMLRRLLLSLQQQRQMALDVKQAQEVQEVILPQARSSFPGLEIESEYRPAREVGGDFFQILPSEKDGSLLIVAGDVTGKGLKAGMLVALLVGAVRTAAEVDTEPEWVLQSLNRRLLGRGDAQATCLALRIEKNGAATLANAGHMAPYINGEPLPMEGALPLGMIEEAEFSVMRFHLSDGDRLMVMSDGISEATSATGDLFGFERVNELLRTSTSAEEVAAAAQRFGQEDDISVISVRRTPAAAAALA